MQSIQSILDARTDEVAGFKGLLSALLYTRMNAAFRKYVRSYWDDLDAMSGTELLILTPDRSESAEATDAGSADSPTLYDFMTVVGDPARPGKTAIDLAKALEISYKEFPCIAFFSSLADKQPYCFSFLVDGSEAELTENFQATLQCCRDVAQNPPATAGELSDWRNRKLIELEPLLNRQKFIRQSKRLATKISLGQLLQVGKAAAGLLPGQSA